MESTLRGSQASWPISVNSDVDPRDTIFAEADTNRNQRQGSMSMSASLDRSLQYPEIHATSDIAVLSTLSNNYSLPTAVQCQERSSIETPRHSRNLGAGPTAALSRSPQIPSEDRFRCNICGLDFAQRQGVTRHYREVHEDSLCLHCEGFVWHRRHQLRVHLEERHPDVHLHTALAEATRRRRRATIKNRIQGQQYFPTAIEYDRSRWGEHLPQPLTPLPQAARRREYAFELTLFDTTYAYVAFSSTESHVPPPNAVNVPFRG
jgi:hypothetical protein